jgi:hypothetical protein
MSKLSKAVRSLLSRSAGCQPTQRQPVPFNEAINLQKGVIFIAIPKTGTTSVRDQLGKPARAMVPNPHLNIMQVRDLMYPMLLQATLGTNNTYPNADMPTDATIRTTAQRLFTDLFKFSAVRNPWARAVSLWKRKEGIQSGDSADFATFLEHHTLASDTCRHPTQHACQIDWLCDEHGRVLMDYVYKVEEFDQAITDIRERTDGRLILQSRHLNANPRSSSGRYRDLYTNRTRTLVATRFERDIDTFKYVF